MNRLKLITALVILAPVVVALALVDLVTRDWGRGIR